MVSEDVIDDVTCLPRKYLFTFILKTPISYLSGNTEPGKVLHSLGVRLIQVIYLNENNTKCTLIWLQKSAKMSPS